MAEVKRNKTVTNQVHRLFWRAMVEARSKFVITILFHSPSFFLMNIVIPIQIAYCIQAIILKDFGAVPRYAVSIIVITVVANAILAIGTWAFNRDGTIGAKYVQNRVFDNYLSKDFEFYSNTYTGALGTQAASLREAYVSYNRIMMFDIPKAAVIIIAALVVIAINSIPLAIVSILCMLLVFSFTIASGTFRLKYRRQVSEASSDLAGVVGDSLAHASVVKSFGNVRYEIQRLHKTLAKWEKAQLKSWDMFTPVNFGRNVLLAIAMAILLVMSANLYKDGVISIAIITLVQLYVVRLISTTVETANIIKEYEAVMSSAYQPIATMMLPASVTDQKPVKRLDDTDRITITFDKATYRYPEMSDLDHAIVDFSFSIDPGKKIGLVGYSGSGKTTLTKLALRFMDTTSGSIMFNGIDLRHLAQDDLRALVAYVPQEPLLFHRSIWDNIAYAKPNASKKQVEKAAKLAFVHDFVKDLPQGYQTVVGERGVKLSGGQRQRVAIARALLKDAPILILDEATSALDSQSEHYIQKALNELMKHRTSIVVAHRLSTIQKMDEIVVMDKGKIIELGTHNELIEKKAVYANLWSHQSGGYLEID